MNRREFFRDHVNVFAVVYLPCMFVGAMLTMVARGKTPRRRAGSSGKPRRGFRWVTINPDDSTTLSELFLWDENKKGYFDQFGNESGASR